jgi:TonB family protein
MVVDRDGVPVADAAVKIADPETKAILITGVTDERGSFSLTLSPRESVEVLVSHDGFKPAVISGVKLPDGVPVNVRVALQPAGGSATVTIHAGGQATATQTNRPTGGRAIPASVISRVDPGYPAAAMQQGIEAVVMVETRVDADGNVSELRIIKGHPMFDEAAMNAVRQWRFRPAQLNGQPRQGSVTVTFVFRI